MHEEIVILLVSWAIIIEPAIPTPATRYDRLYHDSCRKRPIIEPVPCERWCGLVSFAAVFGQNLDSSAGSSDLSANESVLISSVASGRARGRRRLRPMPRLPVTSSIGSRGAEARRRCRRRWRRQWRRGWLNLEGRMSETLWRGRALSRLAGCTLRRLAARPIKR